MTTPAPATSPALIVCLWHPHGGTLAPADVRAALLPVAPGLAALLPDGDSTVAALGKAVAAAGGVAPRGVEWSLYARRGGGSRWVRADAEREHGGVRILGDQGVEVDPAGVLTFDGGVPTIEADAIRAAYRAARGGVDGAVLGRHVAAWIVGSLRGVRATGAGGAWLVDGAHAQVLRGVRDALAPLGATLAVHGVMDADVLAYGPTVTRTIGDEVADVLADADAALAAAVAAASGTGTVQARSGASTLDALDRVAERAGLWRDRLRLSLGDVDARIAALRVAVDDAYTSALDAQRIRRDEARAALRDDPLARAVKASRKPASPPASPPAPAPAREDAPAPAREDDAQAVAPVVPVVPVVPADPVDDAERARRRAARAALAD